jgi:hypothetical protein
MKYPIFESIESNKNHCFNNGTLERCQWRKWMKWTKYLMNCGKDLGRTIKEILKSDWKRWTTMKNGCCGNWTDALPDELISDHFIWSLSWLRQFWSTKLIDIDEWMNEWIEFDWCKSMIYLTHPSLFQATDIERPYWNWLWIWMFSMIKDDWLNILNHRCIWMNQWWIGHSATWKLRSLYPAHKFSVSKQQIFPDLCRYEASSVLTFSLENSIPNLFDILQTKSWASHRKRPVMIALAPERVFREWLSRSDALNCTTTTKTKSQSRSAQSKPTCHECDEIKVITNVP